MPRVFRCKYVCMRTEKREQNDSRSGKHNLLGAGLVCLFQNKEKTGEEERMLTVTPFQCGR